jgi:hypothetical protein
LGLSQDTFRHWKRSLKPLSGRNGYTPCFTPGDLFAVATVHALVTDAGVRVGAIAAISEELFRFATVTSWAVIERSVLVFDLAAGRLTIVQEANSIRPTVTGIHVPCRPIVAKLRERLLAEQDGELQQLLQFPPAVVAGRTGTGGEQA